MYLLLRTVLRQQVGGLMGL